MSATPARALASGNHHVIHIALAVLIVAAPGALGAQARARITGVVRDSMGLAVAGAEVTLAGSQRRAVSDPQGSYRVADIPLGRATLRVRRLGFQPLTMEVAVDSVTTYAVDLWLAPVPHQLAPVLVRERREVYDARLAGFEERRAKKVGHFITRERIERSHSSSLVDLLREVPGVRIAPRGGIDRAVRLRGSSCAPLVFIDGAPASAAEFDLGIIDPATVEGVEVYSSVATVPSQFVGPRGLDRCGVIAIWSRPARPRARAVAPAPVDLERLLQAELVFTADQVDSAAVLMEGSAPPEYPDSLWRAGVAGRVVAEFVVDTTGAVEPGTVRIASASHAPFSDAVHRWAGSARFVPAISRGRRVRQIVILPFEFGR